tara:strand:- start:243 stop:476 length:234 start_codon:yes stop_codon:yes gene_type:complete
VVEVVVLVLMEQQVVQVVEILMFLLVQQVEQVIHLLQVHLKEIQGVLLHLPLEDLTTEVVEVEQEVLHLIQEMAGVE